MDYAKDYVGTDIGTDNRNQYPLKHPKIMFPLKKVVNLSLFLLSATLCTWAQTVLMPMPRQCFLDSLSPNSGLPLAGGKLFTYEAGTTTQQATFADATGAVSNTNPVILDAAGCASIWMTPATAYKIVAQNSSGAQEWTADNVTGLATTQSAANQANTQEVFSSTPTFTSLAENQLFTMTLTGNVTSSSLVMSGVSTPATLTFELTQDGSGNRTFSWPANFSGAQPIDLAPNAVTTQAFFWDGTTAYAISNSRSGGNDHAMPGEVRMYAGSTAPPGWLLCQGQALSRLTYASLFSVVGTTYGAGDGSSTFNLPDIEGRAVFGAGQGGGLTNRTLAAKGGEENHTLTVAEMPSHTHTASPTWSGGNLPATFTGTTAGAGGAVFASGLADTLTIGVSFTGGGAAHNNMPPYVVLNYICKY